MDEPFQDKKGGGYRRYDGYRYSEYATTDDPQKIKRRVSEAIEKADDVPDKPHNPEKLMDESRKTIAYWFVISFIVIVGAVLVLVPLYNAIVFHDAKVVVEKATYQPLDIAQVLAVIGTLLGTPLGFVVGYYFKEEHTRRTLNRRIDSK